MSILGADPFGFPTLVRPWDDGSNTMANAKRRLRAAFEFFTKLGVKYWCFHDRYDNKNSVFQIKIDNRYNLRIFSKFLYKIIYFDPSLGPSQGDDSNE